MSEESEERSKEEKLTRTVFLSGTINEKSVKEIINKLLDLERDNPVREIKLLIDSYGGSLDSMFALVDTLRFIKPELWTVCVGKAMSAAALVLAAGKKGKRFISPNGRVLIHQIYACTFGKVDEIENDVLEFRRLQKRFEIEMANLTGQRLKKIQEDMKRKDLFMDAQQAVKYGLADQMLKFNKNRQ